MKTLMMIAFTILSMNVNAQDLSKVGPKGGELKLVQNYNIEMVNSVKYISVYLYDKDLNSIANEGVLSEIIFCYPYDECLNKPLKPNGKFGYIANVVNPNYDYCDININLYGNLISAKFNNVFGLVGSTMKN